MSAVRDALVAEILRWADPGKGAEEAAYVQIDNFLKTSLGQKVLNSLKFEQALRQIEDPVGFIVAEAERDGNQVNGGMLVALAQDAGYLKGIAKDALRGIPKMKVV